MKSGQRRLQISLDRAIQGEDKEKNTLLKKTVFFLLPDAESPANMRRFAISPRALEGPFFDQENCSKPAVIL